ncbi:MAG TPA: hypothetical protein VGL20_02785 [Candidatus Dormibacteraeota bacterium]
MRLSKLFFVAGVAATVGATGAMQAANADSKKFEVKAANYDPGKTHTVTSQWTKNLGLDDNNGKKNRKGLLLSKNAPTATNSAAGATIRGVKGIVLTELGYDVRDGSHCSGGAPRFDVITVEDPTVVHFVGACTNGTVTPNTPVAGWSRVRFDPANGANTFPPIPAGQHVSVMDITFDEGTDTAGGMPGLAVIDNIDINGTLVGSGNNSGD